MSRPQGAPYQALFESLAPLRERWPGGGWSWDTRFSCVSSSFNAELAHEARAAVHAAFAQEWTARSLAKAPSLVREVADNTGGVRPDQVLYCSDTVGGTIVFGLWWPWGDDVTISFRVGLAGFAAAREEFQLRDTFNALD